MKNWKMPIQGEPVLRKGSSSFYNGNVQASKDCDVCCSLSSSCPGCTCSIV